MQTMKKSSNLYEKKWENRLRILFRKNINQFYQYHIMNDKQIIGIAAIMFSLIGFYLVGTGFFD